MYAQALDTVTGDKMQMLHIACSAFNAHGERTFRIYSSALNGPAMQTNPKPCFAFDDIEQFNTFFDSRRRNNSY